MPKISRRRLLMAASAVGSSLLVEACASPVAPPVSVATGVATGTPNATARAGGMLRYATIGDFATLEAHNVVPNAVDTLWGIWDRLTFYDDRLQPQPMLAESWDSSTDSTRLKLNLRRGVQFHTGRELTADDVKWCLERVQDPKISSVLLGPAHHVISSVDAPDRYSVVVTTSRPIAEAFDLFEYLNIIDPVTVQNVGISRPTGTGPFVLSDYVQGDHLHLTRNRSYWRNDRPYLDDVLVSISSDAQASVAQLEAGALDVVGFGVPVAAAMRLQTDPRYVAVFNTKTGAAWCLVANCRQAPTNNKLVRQALSYALDRKRISEVSWRGQAEPEALPWAVTSPAYDAARTHAFGFDLDKARSLLAASGASMTNLELSWPTALDVAAAAQIYHADLAKIGVTLALKPLEPPAFLPSMQRGTFQHLALVVGGGAQLHPAGPLRSSLYASDGNFSGFSDDAYTQLLSRVLDATDPVQQKRLYAELNDYLLDQSWVLPITQAPPHLAARSNVHGLHYDGHEALVLSDVWLA